ncbi:hypothetical protein F4X73_15990 [Candidatus Poribacteria bacterium]|nr:hypothetical protein [Candidatus Poribacteria bacterium]MYB66186.1 hypothetical protein [Candidatus Poribacteria bacterium]MYF55350.1 hypothetical protein [Candidatus Poribacteria bacterium]
MKTYSKIRVIISIIVSVVVFLIVYSALDENNHEWFFPAVFSSFLTLAFLLRKALWGFILDKARELSKAIRDE